MLPLPVFVWLAGSRGSSPRLLKTSSASLGVSLYVDPLMVESARSLSVEGDLSGICDVNGFGGVDGDNSPNAIGDVFISVRGKGGTTGLLLGGERLGIGA